LGTECPNRAQWLGIGLEVGKWDLSGWFGSQDCTAVVNERVEGQLGGSSGWGLEWALNAQTESDGSEWGWRWAHGARMGGLGLQGPAAVVNRRVEGSAERAGWGFAPNTQTEHDGLEWGWRWTLGAQTGGLGFQGRAAVVNERVEGLAWGFKRAGAGVWHRTPKPSATAQNGVGGGHLGLVWVVWGFRDAPWW
jgi:hypothetical protein